MTRTTATLGLGVLIAVGFAVAYLGWRVYTSSETGICDVCNRPLHAHTRTVAELDGRREAFCCPTCALTAAKQGGGALKFIEFTDYVSHAKLDPGTATLVEGSDVNPCIQHEHEMVTDQERQTVPLDFDRCSPSVLAFGDAQVAEDFLRVHGGRLIRLDELLKD